MLKRLRAAGYILFAMLTLGMPAHSDTGQASNPFSFSSIEVLNQWEPAQYSNPASVYTKRSFTEGTKNYTIETGASASVSYPTEKSVDIEGQLYTTGSWAGSSEQLDSSVWVELRMQKDGEILITGELAKLFNQDPHDSYSGVTLTVYDGRGRAVVRYTGDLQLHHRVPLPAGVYDIYVQAHYFRGGGLPATPFENSAFFSVNIIADPFPTIFIPGIAGSMLTGNGQTGANGNGEYLWPTFRAGDIRALNPTSQVNDIRAVGIIEGIDPDALLPINIGLFSEIVFYRPLIDYLTGLGLLEYKLEEDPDRLTNGHMLQQAWSEKPNLFTFPYDWRQSNASHVSALHSYISHIKQLHGADKVNIIAHSMGGLLLRQYLLTPGYAADIDKVVTIGTPVWGAPKAVYRLLSGEFFPISAIDWNTSSDMKAALRAMPSTAELIPPFEIGHISGRVKLLSEEGWNLNNEGSSTDVYSPAAFWKFINGIAPGFHSTNAALHTLAQDDWGGDGSGISYLQVFGLVSENGRPTTTTDVVAFEKTWSVLGDVVRRVHGYREVKGHGDNVVPLESASRPPQYLAPKTESFALLMDSSDAASNPAEHTELTKSAGVHAKIGSFLGLTAPTTPGPPGEPAYSAVAGTRKRRSITLYGTGYVPITDSEGNQNMRLGDAAIKKIPGLEIAYHPDEGWMEITGDVSKVFTILDTAATGELEALIVNFNAAGEAESFTRYRFAPSNQNWRLTLPANGRELRVDSNRNGTFETAEVVLPANEMSQALDLTPPSITMTLGLANKTFTLSVSGTDNSGTPTIRYSIDGGALQIYSAPLSVPIDKHPTVKVYAEDAAGNTSGLIETAVNPDVRIAPNGSAGVSLAWPISDAYVLEESGALTDPWVPANASIARSEFTDSVVVPFNGNARRFFRLRSKAVSK